MLHYVLLAVYIYVHVMHVILVLYTNATLYSEVFNIYNYT